MFSLCLSDTIFVAKLVSGWASTLSSTVPHHLTYQGRFDLEAVWAESYIFVKLASADDTGFVLVLGWWRAENT